MPPGRTCARDARSPTASRGRRGLYAHPTATIAAVRSGQALLADEITAHAHGYCTLKESR